jgi:hypothetical protein
MVEAAAPSSLRTRKRNAPEEASGPSNARPKSKKQLKREARARRTEDLLETLKSSGVDPQRVVGADPGKRNLLVLSSESAPDGHLRHKDRKQQPGGQTISYSFRQRAHEAGHLRRNAQQAERRPPEVTGAEQGLADYDGRVTGLADFIEYLAARFRAETVCQEPYAEPIWRLIRWYNWRGRRRADDKFAYRVVQTFGPTAVIAYGTGAGFHALPNLPPSPVQGLFKRIKAMEHFGLNVVPTPEPYTTRTCSRCKGQLDADPSRIKYKNQRWVVPRGIRRCNSVTCGGRRWDRDTNAVINIRANLIHRLTHGTWYFGHRRDGDHTPDDQDPHDDDDGDEAAAVLAAFVASAADAEGEDDEAEAEAHEHNYPTVGSDTALQSVEPRPNSS